MLETNQNRNSHQTYIATYTALAFLVGSAVWIAMLLYAASQLRNQPQGGETAIAIGPLTLNHVSKIADDAGYVVSLSVSAGLVWYAIGWVALGVVAGILRARLCRKAK